MRIERAIWGPPARGGRTFRECDVLIVGAGPAGLMAATSISSRSDARVIVIDAGEDVRPRLVAARTAEGPTDHLVKGVGGAGLFSDGKLALALDVGGDFPGQIDPVRQDSILMSIRDALGIFDFDDESPRREVDSSTWKANQAGFAFRYYPVHHIGTDQCFRIVRRLSDNIRKRGVVVWPKTRLLDLSSQSEHAQLVAHLDLDGSRTTISASNVILAMGKVGAGEVTDFCGRLGITSRPQRMYVGVRFETDAEDVGTLFSSARDPKLKLEFPDGSQIKTHCASSGGSILPLSYDGLPLAGGHARRRRDSGRASFGVLWNGFSTDQELGTARRIMKRAHDLGGGRIVVQRLDDYTAGAASMPARVDEASPSTGFWRAGNVRDVLPAAFFPRMDLFLDRLGMMLPELSPRRTLLFAPSIEWWMQRVCVDANFETAVPGLFVIGDGSGWSQGVVHAASTGMIAADAILDSRHRGRERPRSRLGAEARSNGR